jgi:site-specific recombinase XerD
MLVGSYANDSIRNYLQEVRLLFQFHYDKNAEELTEQDVTNYIVYIIQVHKVGHAKVKMLANAASYFFRNILRKPYVLPSKLFPRKEWKLPPVMSQDEIRLVFEQTIDLKQRLVVSLLYGTGIRLRELQRLEFTDIERAENRIKIRQGKGKKTAMHYFQRTCCVFWKSIIEHLSPRNSFLRVRYYKAALCTIVRCKLQ